MPPKRSLTPPPDPEPASNSEAAELIQRLHEAALLQNEIAGWVLEANPEKIQQRLLQEACHLLKCEAAFLILTDEDQPGWWIYKSLDHQQKWNIHLQPELDCGPVFECIQSGKIIHLEGISVDDLFDPTCSGEDQIQVHSLIIAPLRTDSKIFGAFMVVNHQIGGFDEIDQEMLNNLSGLATIGLQSASLVQDHRIEIADLEASRWELLEMRKYLQAVLDYLPANLYIIDRDYRLLAVNKNKAKQAMPPEAKGLPGERKCYQTLFSRQEPCQNCQVFETFASAKATKRSERRQTAEMEVSEWEINTFPILDESGQIVQAIIIEQDITERRYLETILAQSDKLAAVGQLAAGIAHEINNPLTAIIANAQILHRDLPDDSDLQESVELIARAGARAAQVVRNLLDFARKEEYRLRLTDLNHTVERALELVQHELVARGILIELKLDPDLPPILASADHLQSVWLNILLNAIDSLDKSPAQITVTSRKIADELWISFADNGKGIPEEQISRIFEPFYTTKVPGRGTGLGLSVSHRIISQHAGRFQVESQPGLGSIFSVVLPAS